MIKLLLYFIMIGMLTFVSCRKEIKINSESELTFSPVPCGDTISYQTEIVPQIINISCNVMGCHDVTEAGGISYLNHSESSSNTHPMYMALIHDTSTSQVHLIDPILPDSLLQKFYCWIQQGRLNN